MANIVNAHPTFIDEVLWNLALDDNADQKHFKSNLSGLDYRASRLLSTVNIPTLSEITVSDLVAIRKSETSFYEWRSALNKVFLEAKKLPVEKGIDNNAEFAKFADMLLRDEANKLKASLKSTTLKAKLLAGATTLSIGGVTALLNNPATAVGVVAGGLSGLLVNMLMERRKRSDVVLAKFYTLFR